MHLHKYFGKKRSDKQQNSNNLSHCLQTAGRISFAKRDLMRNLLFLALIISTFACSAQENKQYEKFKNKSNYTSGYIIDESGQKVYGLVRDMHDGYRSEFVDFVFKDGVKKSLSPKEIKGYGFSIYEYVAT